MNIDSINKIISGLFNIFLYKDFSLTSYIKKPIRIIGKSRITVGRNVFVLDALRMEAIESWGRPSENSVNLSFQT